MSHVVKTHTLRFTQEDVNDLTAVLDQAQSDCEAFLHDAKPAYEDGQTLQGCRDKQRAIDGLRARIYHQCAYNGVPGSAPSKPFNARTIGTEPMVVLSTAHLPEQEATHVEPALEAGAFSGMRRDEGFLIHTGLGGERQRGRQSEFPAMRRLCEEAAEAGVAWLLFDCDGPVLEGLPTYSW